MNHPSARRTRPPRARDGAIDRAIATEENYCYWSEWSEWSNDCSQGGTRNRYRTMLGTCPGPDQIEMEEEECPAVVMA